MRTGAKKIPKCRYDGSTISPSTFIEHLAGGGAPGILPVIVAQPTEIKTVPQVRVSHKAVESESFPTSRTDVGILRRDILFKGVADD